MRQGEGKLMPKIPAIVAARHVAGEETSRGGVLSV
jgi:hypothetical protein